MRFHDAVLAAASVLIVLGLPAKTAIAPPGSFAVTDVSVVSVDGGAASPRRTVIVSGDRITGVVDATTWRAPSGMMTVDGRGLFIVPGLVDAHVHLMSDADLGQFLAAGVTTVRVLMGSPHVLELRDAVNRGALVGPRIVTSGPVFAGPAVPWRDKVVPATPDSARMLVRAQKAAGYDLIKIYDGLRADVYAAVMDEASKLGVRATGHIPGAVHLAGVLAAHQDLEHTDKILFDAWGHAFDVSRIDSVARAIAGAKVAVTPTIASMQTMARINSGGFDSLLARPATQRVSAETLEYWCGVVQRMKGDRPVAAGVRYNPWTDFQMKIIAAERNAGTLILAGSDTPNGLLAAGTSLVDEIIALRESGLDNVEALAAATRNPARVMGDTSAGVIRVGAPADFVLVGGNPLVDLAGLRDVRGVSAAGRWLPRASLDSMAPPRVSGARCAP
jgi:imidazolonepropionase-like amidohydrolase